MPEFLGDTLVVTKDELVPMFWKTYDSLAKILKRYEEKSYGIKRAMYGGHGRRLLVKYDSLPKRVQDAIKDPRKPDHILQNFYKSDAKAATYYHNYQYPDDSFLIPETIEKLIINASVLKALMLLEKARINERITKGGSLRGILNTLYSDAHSFNATLLKTEQLEHTLNSSLRRFKQQYKDFKNAYEENPALGYKSLIRDADGKSKNNAKKITAETAEVLNNLFAGRDHKPYATEVAREYESFLNGYITVTNEVTGEQYDPKNFKAIKQDAIKRYLSSYESKIGTHAKRSGDRQQLMQKFIPYDSTELPVFAGSMITIDDRKPPFEYEKGKRMWWYIGIDIASEAIIAWAYGKTKEELILNFYRQLVINYHQWGVQLPYQLECESSLNSSFKNTFLSNGAMFQEVDIYPNSARSKLIERFIRDLRYDVEKNQPGWIARPFSRSEANQKGAKDVPIIPYDRLVKQCFENIVDHNNSPKKGTTTGRFDYFLQNQHPSVPKTNYKSFIKYLGKPTDTSCHAGIVQLQKQEWFLGDNGEIYLGEKLISLLKKIEGKDIDVYWMPDNEGNVIKALVFDKNDGRYICELQPKPVTARAKLEAKKHHKEARVISYNYRNTVEKYMQQQKNKIDKVTVTDNRTTTVSSTFSIAGIKNTTKSDKPVENVGTEEAKTKNYNPNAKSTANSWKDAFNY